MQPTRIFDLLDNFHENYPKDDALAIKSNGKWYKYSTQEYVDNVRWLSIGLLAMGFQKEDKIITISNNRPEWNFMDMAMTQIGVIQIPVYPTITNNEYKYIFEHSEANLLIISDKKLLQKVKPVVEQVDTITNIYTIDKIKDEKNFWEIIEKGKQEEKNYINEWKKTKNNIQPQDVASIIYTSGTTGLSKGVMLTHRNFVQNAIDGRPALPLNSDHKVLSFLPLCHVYERTLQYIFHYCGISIYYAENMATIVNNLKEIKADGFDTVPRLLEKVYEKIVSKGESLKGIKRKIFFWALKLAHKYEFDGKNGFIYESKLKIADKLVFSKWRAALGGNIKFVGSGGAALNQKLTRVFWAAGIPIQEGYGLTETSPLIAFNFQDKGKKYFGTVGVVIDNVKVKIADDGEILCKGDNVMKGYYKNPEKTKEVIDADGWFHTGDIGQLIEGKYLQITDRKKSIFKLTNGKYISPQSIEGKLKESLFIEHAFVVGDNEKYVSALIVPSFDTLKTWCNKQKIEIQNKSDLLQNPKVISKYNEEIKKINNELAPYEAIKNFNLVADDWSPDTGEYSPTLKLKRQFMKKKYKELLDTMYNDKN